MSEQIVNFKITNLVAEVNESTSFEWQGKAVDSGSFTIELNENKLTSPHLSVKSL
jgi:hypothetical protein